MSRPLPIWIFDGGPLDGQAKAIAGSSVIQVVTFAGGTALIEYHPTKQWRYGRRMVTLGEMTYKGRRRWAKCINTEYA